MNGGASPPGASRIARIASDAANPQRNPRAIGAGRVPSKAPSQVGIVAHCRISVATMPYNASSSHSDTSDTVPANIVAGAKLNTFARHVTLCVQFVSRKKHHAAQTQWNVSAKQKRYHIADNGFSPSRS